MKNFFSTPAQEDNPEAHEDKCKDHKDPSKDKAKRTNRNKLQRRSTTDSRTAMKVKSKVQRSKPLQRPCVPKPATRPRDSRGLRRPMDTRKGRKYCATAGTTRQPTREQTNEIDQRGQRANRVPSKMKIQEQDDELHEILLDQRAAHPHWEAGRSSSHATPKQELKHRASLYYG